MKTLDIDHIFFYLYNDNNNDYCVRIDNPNDEKDFLIVHRSSFDSCIDTADKLNSLIKAHNKQLLTHNNDIEEYE